MPIELWPPLHLIRSQLEPASPVPGGEPVRMAGVDADGAAARAAMPADLLLPLTELARRREALAARAFGARWTPGRLVGVLLDGRLLGVLLDRQAPGGAWHGFLAAGEADWAGPHDVLLEPADEPFEPLFGMIQAWNPVTLMPAPQWLARVQGEVSATRLAAVRAVHDEHAAGLVPDIACEPGRIALRTTGGGAFSVLSGTPLAPDDERGAYQRLYRDAAARLVAASRRLAGADGAGAGAAPARHAGPAGGAAAGAVDRTADAAPAAAPPRAADDGPWQRLRRWLGADGWVRPAFALLALVVVVQNLVLPGGAGDADDALRFRGLPGAATEAPTADLALSFRPDVRMADAQRLLQSVQAEVVAGPDARGTWYLRVPDVTASRAALAASPLVGAVGPP